MAADLSDYPLLPLVLASLIVILVASELGRWTGAHAHARAGGQVTTLESAIFGLLALMIGFTFSMALSRFEARRHAVLSEANAIGTMALRVRLLPAPHDAEMLRLLRDYIRVRLRFARHFPTSAELEGAIAKSNELHEALWQHAMAGIAKEQLSVPAYLILDPLNDMINGQRGRLTAFRNRVPYEITLALCGIAAVAIGFAGYAAVLAARTSRLPVYLTGLLVFAVIILIEDIETPSTGFITVSQQALIDVAASIGAD